jgi:hypothetical protein
MRLACTIVLALMTSGCPDDDGDGSSFVGVDEIADAHKAAYCEHLVRCGHFPDRAACIGANVTLEFASYFTLEPDVIAAIRAGDVIYNGNNLRACFDSIAMRSCDQTSESYRELAPVCREFLRGTKAPDATCLVDEECISLSCIGSDSEIACMTGTCSAGDPARVGPYPIGSRCFGVGQCVAGAFCDQVSSMCVALLSATQACTGSWECDYGLGCIGATGARTCQPLPTEGQPCADGLCRDDGQYCSNANICTRVGLPPTACTSSSQCSVYYPCDFTAGTCKQGPAVGQPCNSSTRCFAAGTYCDSSSFTCAAVKPDGSACIGELECESEYCDFDLGTCAPEPTCRYP